MAASQGCNSLSRKDGPSTMPVPSRRNLKHDAATERVSRKRTSSAIGDSAVCCPVQIPIAVKHHAADWKLSVGSALKVVEGHGRIPGSI